MVIDADAGRVAIRHMMFLSLTFDHRLVDGAPAARFLQRIKQYIEQPFSRCFPARRLTQGFPVSLRAMFADQ